MKYIIYKITNNINGKIYIGVHKTKNIYDGYMGSGKVIKRAIKKYGIDNFTKEILEYFDNTVDMFSMETKLVNEDFVKRKDTYNIRVGGKGGFDHIRKEDRIKNSKKGAYKANLLGANIKGNQKFMELMKDPEFYKRWRLKITRTGQEFRNKKHTEETKKQMSESQKKHDRNGSKNVMYGKCWIYNDELKISKRINKEDLLSGLDVGWIKGRKMSF